MTLSKLKPSDAHRSEYHYELCGRSISDPYRWMEEDSPDLQTWVRSQHEYTMAQLSSLPVREKIRRRLEELMRAPSIGPITKAGTRYFFRQRLKDQESSALYFKDAAPAPWLFLDPE